MRKLKRTELDRFFKAVDQTRDLFLPVDEPAGAVYKKWSEGVRYSRALNTTRSAKDFFFPQTENIAAFKFKDQNIEVIDTRAEREDYVIFGVRPCDVASFSILDDVFLADPVDTYYQNRREHSVVISMGCTRPDTTCFCNLWGVDATKGNADVDGWMDDEYLYLEANNDKGETLLSQLDLQFEDGGEEAVLSQREEVKKIMEKLPYSKLSLEGFGTEENMLEIFNSPLWEELSSACIGCGTCTFVCPTCQCFDIRDFDAGGGKVERYRCWDSCMYSDFTQMAAANPRHTQKERFRQRFMHKLVYYPSRNEGVYGCVGCGRCLQKCPVHMNIAKVIDKFQEVHHEK